MWFSADGDVASKELETWWQEIQVGRNHILNIHRAPMDSPHYYYPMKLCIVIANEMDTSAHVYTS